MENTPQNNDFNKEFETSGESTIFSAPVSHSTKNQYKTKKRWITVTASFLAVVALIGSTFAVIKLIPKKKDGNNSLQNGYQSNTITVLNQDKSTLKTVTVKNANGTFSFFPETLKSEGEETTEWYLKGYEKDLIDSYAAEIMVDTASVVTASKEITEMSDSDCGLDKPIITISLQSDSDKNHKILIGDTAYDQNNCYIKLVDTDKIYLTSIDIKDTLDFEALDLASTDDLPAFKVTDDIDDKYLSGDGDLASFDSITVSGKNFSKNLVIKPNNNEVFAKYGIYPYLISSPSNRIANDETVPEVFSLFTNGLSVSGAYSFDVKAATLKKFGLDKPDFMATLSVEGKTMTYKFALQKDGDYAVVCDKSKLISKVAVDTISFVEYELSDFYSTFVSLFTVTTLDSFEIKVGDKEYKFNITATKKDDDTEYTVSYNGKSISWDKFTDFYQNVATLPCSDFTIQSVKGNPDYTFTFNFNKENGGGKTVTKFYKVSDTRYQYSTDGINLGKVTSYSLKKIIESVL